MKSLSLDSPESTELHSHIKRRYPPSGPVHFNIQGGSAGLLDHNTPPSNNSRLHCKCLDAAFLWFCFGCLFLFFLFFVLFLNQFLMQLVYHNYAPIFRTAPLSPSTARRLGYNRNLRTTSVELPDEVDKSLSLSSASTSPCSSPGRQNLAV